MTEVLTHNGLNQYDTLIKEYIDNGDGFVLQNMNDMREELSSDIEGMEMDSITMGEIDEICV